MKKAVVGALGVLAAFSLFKLSKGFWSYMGWDSEDTGLR